MEEKDKSGDGKNSYDALRNMFLQPPVYLPPPLGQSMEGGLIPGVLPGQGAASSLMFNPFLSGMPLLPYRDFAYLPFPAAAAALEGRSGQSPSGDGAAAASAANFWTGLYPFVTDPFMAEAMKMNLSPYLPDSKDSKKNSSGKDVKKSTLLKTDVNKDLKRKPERSSSTHSESSTSSHDRQTPQSKSPATRVNSSPHRKELVGPPPLIKTPPLAHERKRPKLDPSEEALDFSSKPKFVDSKKSLLPRNCDRERVREEKKPRSAPNFGDVEWLSNPDSSPKKTPREEFLTHPNSVLRGEALQVRIAQYNVSQLRSKLDLDLDENMTARIEPDYSDLGSYKDAKDKLKLDCRNDGSAFERVEQKLGRDSVIVSRNEPKSFSERMSDIARRHAAANDLKDPGIDMKNFSKSSLDLRGMSFPRHSDIGLDLKLPVRSSTEPSNLNKSPVESKSHEGNSSGPKKDSMTLKDSVDNILDSILNTYDDKDDEPQPKPSAIHSKNDCDSQLKDKDEKPDKKEESKVKEVKKVSVEEVKKDESLSKSSSSKNEEVGKTSGGEMHGISSSFLPLSEVLSTAISSEFARSQNSPSCKNNENSLFPQTSSDYSGQPSEENPYMSIENIINRLENDDDDERDDETQKDHTSSSSSTFLNNSSIGNSTTVKSESSVEFKDSKALLCDSRASSVNNEVLSESKLANVNTTQCKQSDITTGQNHQKCDESKTKLVLVKDPRNGYAVKGLTGQDGVPVDDDGIVTTAVVEKVVNSVMGGTGVENGIS